MLKLEDFILNEITKSLKGKKKKLIINSSQKIKICSMSVHNTRFFLTDVHKEACKDTLLLLFSC